MVEHSPPTLAREEKSHQKDTQNRAGLMPTVAPLVFFIRWCKHSTHLSCKQMSISQRQGYATGKLGHLMVSYTSSPASYHPMKLNFSIWYNNNSRALNPSVSNLPEAQRAVHVQLKLSKLKIYSAFQVKIIAFKLYFDLFFFIRPANRVGKRVLAWLLLHTLSDTRCAHTLSRSLSQSLHTHIRTSLRDAVKHAMLRLNMHDSC